MKIGEKQIWKKGRWKFEIERIPFDWKVLVSWIIFIGLIIWLIWFK